MEANKNCGCSSSGEKKDVIKGINCDVYNCHYHDGKCHCTADCISVGPREASTSADTLCATFKPREY